MLPNLHPRYSGRIFAFDHPTIVTSSDQNVSWLIDNLPGDGWDLDVIAHPRGGLVARALVEHASGSAAAGRIQLHRIVFLGTPNAATPLADMNHMERYVDVMTNLLQFFAIGLPIARTVASVLEVVERRGGRHRRPRRTAGDAPNGRLLAQVEGGNTNPRYFGLVSDFEPGAEGKMTLKDGVIDRIFGSDGGKDLWYPPRACTTWASRREPSPSLTTTSIRPRRAWTTVPTSRSRCRASSSTLG